MILEEAFGQRLRASEQASVQRIALYLADTNKHDELVEDLTSWITRAVRLLTDINDGCTRLPLAYGTWSDDEGTTFEHSVIIYSYIRNPTHFVNRLDEIVAFVHRYGRGAQQKAVMVEFSGGDFGNYFSRAYFVKEADYLDLPPIPAESAP